MSNLASYTGPDIGHGVTTPAATMVMVVQELAAVMVENGHDTTAMVTMMTEMTTAKPRR